MECSAQYLDYEQTGAFSKIVIDYLEKKETLHPFYEHPVSLEGMKASIEARKAFPTDRTTLTEVLKVQYGAVEAGDAVSRSIELLQKESTFTLTTAHQPNIFTGYLYFIYKIVHTIKLAEQLKQELPQYDFVPVYFMGSEDADLEELGHINVHGDKLVWDTKQKGAVGRMNPKGLEQLIQRLEGEFGGLPHGKEMVALCRRAYLEHATIQEATFFIVHELFKSYGLVIIIPDNAVLKRLFVPVMQRELEENFSHKAVVATIEALQVHYKVQAAGREVNLFYLKDDQRNRIVWQGGRFVVNDTSLVFSREELLRELQLYPERFSPNVILRGVFQELILPSIAFIGGGGELAYWLELRGVFQAAGVPFPVLMLRNSFLLVRPEWAQRAAQLGFSFGELFQPEQELFNQLIKRESSNQLTLHKELGELAVLYRRIMAVAGQVDPTLEAHVASLHTRAAKGLTNLQKKILKAEKNHFEAHQRQIHVVKQDLFPRKSLQERVDNFMPWYAQYGPALIAAVNQASPGLVAKFVVLVIE